MRCDAMRCDAMRCTAMHCDALRCTAMHCNVVEPHLRVPPTPNPPPDDDPPHTHIHTPTPTAATLVVVLVFRQACDALEQMGVLRPGLDRYSIERIARTYLDTFQVTPRCITLAAALEQNSANHDAIILRREIKTMQE